jgi:DNA-binding transcriptional LysR family regulator
MIPSERLKGIEAFVCAADTGSFTAAGAQLNLTSSAISKGVARLEARLGAKLFERTTRSLALTDAGAAFYATCVRVLAELSDAEAVLATHRSAPAGRLRIDVPVAFGRMRVMPLVLDLVAQHPDLRPHISFTDRFVDIIEERIDVAVRIGASDVWPPGLGHHYIGSERVVFCAAPCYLDRRGSPATADDLAAHDCILYGQADGSITWRFHRDDGPVERRPVEGRIVLGSAEAQVGAVVAGFGIAQLATWLIDDQLRSGELVEILPGLATAGLPLEIVWPRSRQLLPKVDALIALLKSRISIQ